MKITVLGSGTSTGVPVIGCNCEVCLSDNPRNQRLRSSVYIELEPNDTRINNKSYYIIVDTGPDFRTQALKHNIGRIDAVLYTHAHADHIHGLDDIRIFNFIQEMEIPVYAEEQTCKKLMQSFSYCFKDDPAYEGAGVPKLGINKIKTGEEIIFGSFPVRALRLYHGSLPILGYKFGNFAYLTDCSSIPDETKNEISGISYLILDGLRHRPHRTHLTLEEAGKLAIELNIGQTILTHISHDIDYNKDSDFLEKKFGKRVTLAYDGLKLFL
ncbi:MAG TPA: MBL fold metallo-hydrolase [Oligoflexia bacterium]|nr:MBL fold metallo-hydrolase [Oligoflexia bacterium]HMP48655.1 MBL fold metallo-hydrolase [Oligoflexia bacterium]